MNYFYLFLVLVFSVSGKLRGKVMTKKSKMEGYVVRGVSIEIEQFPWLVQITMYDTHYCGGVIVSDRVILTAGHCVTRSNEPVNPSTLVVFVGSTFAMQGQLHYCCEVYAHEKYNEESPDTYYYYDIGLILLNTKIKFGRRAKRATFLPPKKTFRNERFTLSVAGWGLTDSFGSSALSLQMTRLRYLSHARCNRSQTSDGEKMPVPAHMFCMVADKWTSDCFGDSGSGVMWGNYLVGIVATGRDTACGSETLPSMYTDVSYFRNWIEKNVQKLETRSNQKCSYKNRAVLANKNDDFEKNRQHNEVIHESGNDFYQNWLGPNLLPRIGRFLNNF